MLSKRHCATERRLANIQQHLRTPAAIIRWALLRTAMGPVDGKDVAAVDLKAHGGV